MSVHLVEISDALIDEQEKLLCGKISNAINDQPWIRTNKTINGFNIYWYKSLDDVPEKVSFSSGESEFDIFEARKRFSDSGKACVLKRKVAKVRFLPKNDPFWGKNVRGIRIRHL
jgi:hypothetical protein